MLLDNFETLNYQSQNMIRSQVNHFIIVKQNLAEQYSNMILKDTYDFSFYDFITHHSSTGMPILKIKDYWTYYNDPQILQQTRNAIIELYPDYLIVFDYIINHSDKNIMDNLFITKWKYFKQYSEWLFNICFYVQKHIDINKTKQIQQQNILNKKHSRFVYKIFAWLSQHLFIIFLLKNRYTRLEKYLIEFN